MAKMRIVIVGDGKVGFALSNQLAMEGHNITIIDNNQRAIDNTCEHLDVLGIVGNGANPEVQTEAGVPSADLLIAATSRDELNMLCCLMAKHLGCKNTIARVRDPDYAIQLNLLKSQFSLSMAINPELEAAREVARVLKFPPALAVESFSKGRVEIVGYKIREGHSIANKKLKDLPSKYGAKVLICAVNRGGDVIVPNGSFELLPNDKIYITGESSNIISFLNSVGQDMFKIKNIMIVGGGKICHYLASMLEDRGLKLKIIEKDIERCNELCETFPRAVVIHGDGTDIDLLESENLVGMDAFVALTGIDEENMIISMLANRKKVPKTIAKVNRLNYMALANEMGIDTTFNPKMSAVNQITQYVRAISNTKSSEIKTVHKLFDGSAEALEFVAIDDTKFKGHPLQSLKLKPNLLIAVIVRGGHVIIPNGKDSIMLNDSVIIITNSHHIQTLNDIFEQD